MGKIVYDAQEGSPKAFQQFLIPYLEFCCPLLLTYNPNTSPYPDKFYIAIMIFLRAVIEKRRDSSNSELYNKTAPIFTRDFVARLSAVLISSFFPTTDEELRIWEEDPEELINSAIRNVWREEKKVCFTYVCIR